MVIDSSAVMAVLQLEPTAAAVARSLDADPVRIIGAPTRVEVGIVAEARFGADGARMVERFLRDGEVEVLSFDRRQADLAIDAWRRFGEGRHPAGLNFGDCFAYAAARALGEPLLCVGNDFAKTDLAVVDLDV
jgi:ribonuclease VapC